MGAPIKVRGTGNYGVETATLQRILRKVSEDTSMGVENRAGIIKALNTVIGLFNADTADAVLGESKGSQQRPRVAGVK